ncbi:ran-binding protein 3 isoform X2 [Plodia interpunctella]|nr:ran-binding protein 3 isoform X2 [Plodia interpunctella]XP_053602493.1 ran-binding protein 3 isoform X2 [Plodia interpunctella]
MEDFCNGSSQSRVVLAKPRLGGIGSSGFGSSSSSGSSKSCNPIGSVLRPPQLKPGNNPFLKATEPSEDSEPKTEPENSTKETKEDIPKFVPLGSSNVTPRTANPVPAPAQPASSSSSFVFGQNLSERVVINENLNNGEASSSEHSSTNGTSELLFTSAAASVKDNVQESRSGDSAAGLARAAAEYERSHAAPPPPAAAPTATGEEDETNVAQISCRLFAWESGSWRERGRGVLRLNDSTNGGPPRLVARVAGSLRVALNTRVWPAMVVERAAAKSLRITAADSQNQIKLFLIMGAPVDIAHLHRALQTRIAISKRTSSEFSSQKAESRLEPEQDYPDSGGLPHDDHTSDQISDHNSDATSDAAGDAAGNDRLTDEQKTDETIDTTDKESKTLKRKEPAGDETSPKRQCPEIVIE